MPDHGEPFETTNESGEFNPGLPAADVAASFVSLADGLGIHHRNMSVERRYQLGVDEACTTAGMNSAVQQPA